MRKVTLHPACTVATPDVREPADADDLVASIQRVPDHVLAELAGGTDDTDLLRGFHRYAVRVRFIVPRMAALLFEDRWDGQGPRGDAGDAESSPSRLPPIKILQEPKLGSRSTRTPADPAVSELACLGDVCFLGRGAGREPRMRAARLLLRRGMNRIGTTCDLPESRRPRNDAVGWQTPCSLARLFELSSTFPSFTQR